MQLIKPKIILLGEINFPSENIQQLTASLLEIVPQDALIDNKFDAVGIICSHSVYLQKREYFPENMPILTDDEWQDPEHLDRFLIQIYTLLRLEQLSLHLTHHQIIQFHSRYKYLIMAYSPKGYQLTGKSVANISSSKRNEISELKSFFVQYKDLLLTIFAQTPPRSIQVNTLSHIQGYFKHKATKDEKKHLLYLISEYREGNISLNFPLEMLRQLLGQYPDNYLSTQYYFEPYPNCKQIRELPYF